MPGAKDDKTIQLYDLSKTPPELRKMDLTEIASMTWMVQRWESERHLPVHRLPGGNKPRVYALPSSWLRLSPSEDREPASVAVLPFVNQTADKESEYFADDEVIDALTRIPGLRVTARTSWFAFRSKEQDVREIGARLGVAALLEGSVRTQHNRVRVSAQLVGAADGFHLWSESYRPRAFRHLRDSGRAGALYRAGSESPADTGRSRRADDLEAYNLWLKGRCLGVRYTLEAIAGARQCFEAAIARDPCFPLPPCCPR